MAGSGAKFSEFKLYINGEFVDSESGETFTSVNPGNLEEICKIARGGPGDIDKAVQAAQAAFPGWARKNGAARAKTLQILAGLVAKNADTIAELEALDVGKPIRDTSKIDAVTAIDAIEYFAGMATKVEGTTKPVPGPYYNMAVREPLGVIGGITPWNYPLLQAIWKIAPAVAAGNTVVIKPAEQACMSVLFLAQLCNEAGFPPGVINIVPGFGEDAGDALVKHPDVAKIMFTGSTDTGILVARNCSDTLKTTSLELGGKSAVIVYPDAPLDGASAIAAMSIFSNQGQVCTAGSRLLVHSSIHDEMVEKVVERAKKVKLGYQMDPDSTMGPLVSQEQMDRVESYIASGKKDAELVYEHERPDLKGFYVGPTVFDKVTNDMKIAREEIFGPVLSIITYEEDEEAIAIANDTPYGLACSILTRDIGRAMQTAQQIKVGNVWINTWGAVSSMAPYGGYKMSGYGREMGFSVMQELTQEKSIWINIR